MSIVRPGDFILAGKTRRGTFIAYHYVDDGREFDDCDSFLFRAGFLLEDDNDGILIAARRLLLKLGSDHKVSKEESWWDGGFRVFPIDGEW